MRKAYSVIIGLFLAVIANTAAQDEEKPKRPKFITAPPSSDIYRYQLKKKPSETLPVKGDFKAPYHDSIAGKYKVKLDEIPNISKDFQLKQTPAKQEEKGIQEYYIPKLDPVKAEAPPKEDSFASRYYRKNATSSSFNPYLVSRQMNAEAGNETGISNYYSDSSGGKPLNVGGDDNLQAQIQQFTMGGDDDSDYFGPVVGFDKKGVMRTRWNILKQKYYSRLASEKNLTDEDLKEMDFKRHRMNERLQSYISGEAFEKNKVAEKKYLQQEYRQLDRAYQHRTSKRGIQRNIRETQREQRQSKSMRNIMRRLKKDRY